MTRPRKLVELALRIAAALVLALAPWVARANAELCDTSPVPQVYIEMETSRGIMGLCLIHDESEDASPEATYLTLISEAFMREAKQGAFNDSFFHRAVACPDLMSCSAAIHGGSFRLAVGEISDPGGWWAPPDPADPNSGAFSNDHYMLSVVRNTLDEDQGDWFINAQDNSQNLNWPREAYEVFGRVVIGRAIVDEIAALPTLDTSRSPSKLHVRLAENACLSGEFSALRPEAALDDCPCPVYDAEGTCIAPLGYIAIAPPDYPTHSSVAERPLWVRNDGESTPCIHNDEEPEESCICEPDDFSNGTCVDFDTYLESFGETELKVQKRVDTEPPCISGDEFDYDEECDCTDEEITTKVCIEASDYPEDPSVADPELWVRQEESFSPCLRGDIDPEENESDPCDSAETGVNISARIYGATFADLQVNLLVSRNAEDEPCISGDEDEAVEECDCSVLADCDPFEDYLNEFDWELGVRFPTPPCISGDDESEVCLCDEDDKGEDGPCELFDSYVEGSASLRVSLAHPARLSGDQDPDSTVCNGLDVEEGRCLRADDYQVYVESQLGLSSDLWVDPTPCLSGDVGEDETDPCTCEGTCITAETYGATFENLQVNRDAEPQPCISGDEDEAVEECDCDGAACVSFEAYLAEFDQDLGVRLFCISGDNEAELCLCSESDKEDGTCEPFDDYVSASEFATDVRARQEACIDIDEEDTTCNCNAADHCIAAEDYLNTPPELWVRASDGNPCISGDQETETECDCTDPNDCVPLDEYASSLDLDYALFVRLTPLLCLSGDDSEDLGSCICSPTLALDGICVEIDDTDSNNNGTSDGIEEVYESLSERDLWVRDDGTEPCISGDETVDDEDCICEADDREEEICVAFDDYLESLPGLELWVRDDGESEPCISGDEIVDEECVCSQADKDDGTCIPAETYPDSDLPDRELWVRDDGESEACINGDQNAADESCICEVDDWEDGTCVTLEAYVPSVRPRDALLVRLGSEPCLSGDAPEAEGSCGCTDQQIGDGTCIKAIDYRDSFPHDWIRLAATEEEACISGDDDEADETCLCSQAKKNSGDCESSEDFLARHSTAPLEIRPAIEPCFSTDGMDGDDSCKCSEYDDGGCMSGGEYLLNLLPNDGEEGEETVEDIHHFTQLPIDITSGDPSIFDIRSSGLVMIRSMPEPSSVWLQGGSVVSLALLARARRRFRRRPR